MTTRWLKDHLLLFYYILTILSSIPAATSVYASQDLQTIMSEHVLFSCPKNKALVKEKGYTTHLSYSAKSISKHTLSSCHSQNSSNPGDTSDLYCFHFLDGTDEMQRGFCWLKFLFNQTVLYSMHVQFQLHVHSCDTAITTLPPPFPPLLRFSHKLLADITI